MLPEDFVDEPCQSAVELKRRRLIALASQSLGRLRKPMVDAIEKSRRKEHLQCQVGSH